MMSDGEAVIEEESTVDDQFLSASDELTEEPLDNMQSTSPADIQAGEKILAGEAGAETSCNADDESLSKKVVSAMKSSAIAAVKVTDDVIQKVGEAVHRNGSKEGLDKLASEDADSQDVLDEDATEAIEDGSAEEKPTATSKVLFAASAASKSVVKSARSAAKVTGEAMQKVTASAETVLFPVNKTGEVKDGEEVAVGAIEDAAAEADAATSGHAAPATEGEGGKNLWSSVKGISGAVGGFSSRAWASTAHAVTKARRTRSSADGAPQPEHDEGEEEGSLEGGSAKNASPTDATAALKTDDGDHAGEHDEAGDTQRARADSISNKLLSSVRRISHTAAEAASAALKAAEPVAEKVSHGAVSAWTSTKEKVRAAAAPKKTPIEEEAETSSVVCETSGSVVGSVTDENGETVDIPDNVTLMSGESDEAPRSLQVEEEESPESGNMVPPDEPVLAVEESGSSDVLGESAPASETARVCGDEGTTATEPADDGASKPADEYADERDEDDAAAADGGGGADKPADESVGDGADDPAEDGEEGVEGEAKKGPTAGGKKKKRKGKGKN